MTKLQMGVQGFFKMEAFQGEYVYDLEGEHILGEDGKRIVHEYPGSRRVVADWFPNQILDAGRNIMSTKNNWAGSGSKCQVGTNSTLPNSLDTQLLGYVNGTAQIIAFSTGANSVEPYAGWDQRTYRFDAGDATGNLSEAAVGWDVAEGPYIITRARIVDDIGDFFTPTVEENEWLDVTYKLYYYPPLEDVEGTVTLAGIVYNTITRASNVTQWGANIGMALGIPAGTTYWKAYDGDIGLITEAPDGTHDDADTAGQFDLTYQNNSYEQDSQINCGINGWNLGAGIRSIWISLNGGQYQTQFNAVGTDNTIPKTIDFYMTLVWRLIWAGWYWAYGYQREASSDATTPTAGGWNTNVAETLLRINWDDSGAADHQLELQLESNTLFRITEDAVRANWAQYRVQAAYTEGVDYTYYTVVLENSQNGGPTVGEACTITAVDS